MSTTRSRRMYTFPADAPPFPEAVAVAELVEAGVFRETFGESAENLRSYYTDHLPQTVFALAQVGGEDDGGWAGMLRLGLPGPRMSLSLEDALAPPFSVRPEAGDDRLLDILTAAVRTRFRRHGIFEDLLAAAVDVALDSGCPGFGMMVDHRVLAYARAGGLALDVRSGLHPYYGSPATAFASIPVPTMATWLRSARAA